MCNHFECFFLFVKGIAEIIFLQHANSANVKTCFLSISYIFSLFCD